MHLYHVTTTSKHQDTTGIIPNWALEQQEHILCQSECKWNSLENLPQLHIIFRSERQSSLDSAQESEKVKKQFGGILSISSILNPTADIEASHDQPWIFFGSQVGPKLAKEHNVDDP